MAGRVVVTGLRELIRDLRAADATLPKELSRATKRTISDILVPEARKRAEANRPAAGPDQGRAWNRQRPQQHWGDLVQTVRGLATAQRGQIALGKNRVPWAAGHEWGTTGKFPQFPARSRTGRILWPALEARHDEILDAYTDALAEITRRAFPE